MPPDLILSLAGFAMVGSFTPGPNNLLVLTSGLNHGFARTIPLIAGISAGFAFMFVAVGVGLATLLQTSSRLQTTIKILGLGYMFWLAWKVSTNTSSRPSSNREGGEPPLSALAGALFQWVNPKAWTIMLSAVAAYTLPSAPHESLAGIACTFIAVSILSLSAWAFLGDAMHKLIDSPKRLRLFNFAMALLLVACTLPVVFDLLDQAISASRNT